jgi:hypothetical protein
MNISEVRLFTALVTTSNKEKCWSQQATKRNAALVNHFNQQTSETELFLFLGVNLIKLFCRKFTHDFL